LEKLVWRIGFGELNLEKYIKSNECGDGKLEMEALGRYAGDGSF